MRSMIRNPIVFQEEFPPVMHTYYNLSVQMGPSANSYCSFSLKCFGGGGEPMLSKCRISSTFYISQQKKES